jgi:ABC-2 type transport system ATP-binding protein
VQAVCDRIIIINKGKIVADERTENISRVVENNRRFNAKICGPQRDILAMLRSKPGIVYAEVLAERDGDAYTYTIESDYGVDIRKNLFYTLAEKGWALIGLEALGMSLEDIFISVVDKTDSNKATRTEARRSKQKTRLETTLASSMVGEAEKRRKEAENDIVEDDE